MANNMQGIYSPLPQSLSDSDSDDGELTMEPVFNSQPHSKATNASTPKSYRQNGHSLHIKDTDFKEDIVKFSGVNKMSTIRKIFFVISIFLCILPIILFLWVLPCSDGNTCPVKIKNWEYSREDIELKGPVNVVQGAYKTVLNLAVMYKGSYNVSKHLKNGVLSITGSSGQLAWDFEQSAEPQSINCTMIDADSNGVMDCLEADGNGLKAIDTASGQAIWHAHSEEKDHPISDLSLPVLLPDLNNDHVRDLLSLFKKEKFFVISGQTGRVLSYVNVSGCKGGEFDKLFSTGNGKIRYLCLNRGGGMSLFEISVDDVEKSFIDNKYVIKPVKIEEKLVDNNSLTVGDRTLTVNNTETCPQCHAALILTDAKNNMLKTWTYNNAYIMNPKPWSFGKSRSKMVALRGHTNGFIIKIWQWSKNIQKLTPNSRIHRRSLTLTNLNETYFVRQVNARVVLITFNETNIHIINASFIELNQICYKNDTDCQPNHDNQKDSFLIADLDQDGSRELVNFYSSYVNRGNNWFLTSYLKVLRLEEELPKLYGERK